MNPMTGETVDPNVTPNTNPSFHVGTSGSLVRGVLVSYHHQDRRLSDQPNAGQRRIQR